MLDAQPPDELPEREAQLAREQCGIGCFRHPRDYSPGYRPGE